VLHEVLKTSREEIEKRAARQAEQLEKIAAHYSNSRVALNEPPAAAQPAPVANTLDKSL
jgi:hypothetical protein